MTAYGTASIETPDYTVKTEIRSLNSRYLDLKIKLPASLASKEILFMNLLDKKMIRGKVDVVVSISCSANTAKKSIINKELLQGCLMEIRDFCHDNKLSEEHIGQMLFSIPDIFNRHDEVVIDEDNKAEMEMAMKALESAVRHFDEFRETEGSKLEHEIMSYLKEIERLNDEIIRTKDERSRKIAERLNNKMEEYFNVEFDKSRFEQELFYYLEKLDITEELERLKSHIKYFRETVVEDDAGRKLSFISQEIGREINTLGAKANDHLIQKNVVMMKNELEKIKQQLANII